MFVDLNINRKEVQFELNTSYEYENDKPTITIITLSSGSSTYSGKSHCHHLDNVNKMYGRRAALKNLNNYDNVLVFTKENRRRLYEALIPKLVKPKRKIDVELIEENARKNLSIGERVSCGIITILLLAAFIITGNILNYLRGN